MLRYWQLKLSRSGMETVRENFLTPLGLLIEKKVIVYLQFKIIERKYNFRPMAVLFICILLIKPWSTNRGK